MQDIEVCEPSQAQVLSDVVSKITWSMLKDVLVKPLPPIMVTKEITKQIPNGKVDAEGFNEYDVETEMKEVESDWATGVVLKLPVNLSNTNVDFKPGDTVVYNKKFAMGFDLFKDTVLVKPYDIIAVSLPTTA